MMRLRLLILALAATLWACHGHAPAPRDAGPATDAGPPPAQHAPEPDPTSAMAKADAAGSTVGIASGGIERLKRHRPKSPAERATRPVVHAPPDPYAAACAKSATDKASLMSCLTRDYHPSAPVPQTAPQDAGGKIVLASAVRPPNHCPALDVANWYFAPAGASPPGNDENTCVTAGSPCLTPQEVMSRWGCGAGPVSSPYLKAVVTWNFLGDMPSSTSFHLDPVMASPGGGFIENCATTTIATGTLSGVVPKNRTNSQALWANLGASAPSYVGYQIIDNTRSAALGYTVQAWVDKDILASDGGVTNVVELTQPLGHIAVPYIFTEPPDDLWANGDSYTIVRPGQIYMPEMSGVCDEYPCWEGYPSNGAYPSVQNCWIQNPGGSETMGTYTQVTFNLSRIDTAMKDIFINLNNSISTFGPIEHRNITINAGSLSEQGDVSGGIIANQFTGQDGVGAWIYSDTIIHGSINIDGYISFESAYVDALPPYETTATIQDNGYVYPIFTTYNTPVIYGNVGVYVWQNGYWSVDSNNSNPIFGSGVNMTIQGPGGVLTNAVAIDYSVNPIQFYNRPLTQASFFQTVQAGGFGGIALEDNLMGGYYNWEPTYPGAPTTYVAPPTGGGTGLDAGPPAGAPIVGGGPTLPYQFGAVCAAGQPILSGGTLGTSCGTTCGVNDVMIGTGSGITCSAPAPVSGQVLAFTGQSPGGLTGLKLWLESNVGVTLSGSNVTAWADQSGNGNNATAAANFPVFSASAGPGSTPQIAFAYGQSLASSTNVLTSGHDRTVWVVGTQRGNTVGGAILFTKSTPYAAMYVTESSPSYVYSDGIAVSDTISVIPSTASHLFEWDYHIGSPIAFYVDGVAQTVSGGNIANADNGTAGYIVGGGGAVISSWSYLGQPTPSDIEEVIVDDHLATGTERTNVGGYVQGKYGLTITGAGNYGWAPVTPPWLTGPLTQYAALLGGGGSTLQFASPGTAGYPLTSNGASSYPTFQQLAYGSLSGTPTIPTLSAGNSGITVSGGPAYTVSNADTFAAGTGISVTGGPAYTVTNAGVTSAVAGTGISVSGATGAVTFSNTGVTSVTAGSGINVSASTGGVTISNTALFTNNVPSGATGFTSCASGDFVQGNGTSPLQCTNIAQYEVITSGGSGTVHGIGPGTTNLPLIGQGASTYPTFGVLQVAGGGTGANTLASGSLIIGNGVGTVNTLAPGTSGNVATSNGSTWVSQAPNVPLGGNIDYVTGTSPTLTASIQVAASEAESITYPRPVIIDATWICYDGVENNTVEVGINVDNNTSIPTAYELAYGLGAAPSGYGAASDGYINISQHIFIGGLSTASHTFYFMAVAAFTPGYAATCTVQAVFHY